jgi:hypothetical protein
VLDRAERVLTDFAGRYGVPAPRITLALTFLWFGTLKITNDALVGAFVADTVSWVPGAGDHGR